MGWFDVGVARSLLKFDLRSVPDGVTVQLARLTLFQNNLGAGSWPTFPVDVYRMSSDSWSEGSATWNNYDQSGAAFVSRLQPPHDNGPRVFNIGLTDWAYANDLQDDAVTFQLRWGDETSQHFKEVFYQSKEGTVAPQLTIDFVPEPVARLASICGFGAFLACQSGIRKRVNLNDRARPRNRPHPARPSL